MNSKRKSNYIHCILQVIMLTCPLAFFFIIFPFKIFSQQADSLRSIIASSKQKEKIIAAYLQLTDQLSTMHFDEAISFVDDGLKVASSTND
ncbi:MAG: hypothetical protein JWQ09_1203, partial [Segetibacter sp.]|nr:hypothetical protein [Segetibacter sp.]